MLTLFGKNYDPTTPLCLHSGVDWPAGTCICHGMLRVRITVVCLLYSLVVVELQVVTETESRSNRPVDVVKSVRAIYIFPLRLETSQPSNLTRCMVSWHLHVQSVSAVSKVLPNQHGTLLADEERHRVRVASEVVRAD